MKKSAFLLICGWFLATAGIFSQQTTYEDVVYLKDGSVLRGQLIEQRIGEYVRLMMNNGHEIELPYHDISKIERVMLKNTANRSDSTVDQNGKKDTPILSNRRNHLEKWYLDCSLGFGMNWYPPLERRHLSQFKKEGPAFGFRMGFYWPLSGHQTLIGIALDGAREGYKDKDSEGKPYSVMIISQPLIVVQHFFVHEIGDGPYGRLEFGPAFADQRYDDDSDMQNSFNGYQTAAEFGYLWPMKSGDTRLGLNARYSFAHTNGNGTIIKGDYHSIRIGGSVLW